MTAEEAKEKIEKEIEMYSEIISVLNDKILELRLRHVSIDSIENM
jgi:hypothetical protein